MALLGLIRTVMTGVAGAPYYTTTVALSDGPGSIDQVADALQAFWTDQASNIDNGCVAVIQSDVPIVESTTGVLQGAEAIGDRTIGMSGAGDPLPATTQALCQLRTANVVAGRRLRGRMFLPQQTEANNTASGIPSAALVGDVNAALTAMIAASGGKWVVWSRTHGTYGVIQTANMWSQWAVLRSRRD